MKPQLGDTISNRYVLVSPLREETGLQVWKASDHVLARDCQLFIVSSSKALQEVNATASMLAISHDSHFTKVLQLQHAGQVAMVVTQLDEGMTLSEYLALNANQPLSYTAMRSIIGEVIESLHALQKDNLTHFSISTDTVRLTRSGIQIADAPVSIMLADTSRAQALENREQLAIRQISALLYAMLIRRPSTLSTDFRLEALAPTTPMEFRVICKRGLELEEDDGFPTVPMATIAELEALLGEYQPLSSLGSMDITLPSMDSECSIANVPLLQILEKDVLPLPDTLAAAGSIPEMTFTAPEPHNDFSDGKEALAKSVAATSGAVKSLWSSGRELLSEEDIDGVTDTSDSPFSFPIRVSVPADGMSSDDSQLEKTGRIPVIGADGQVIQPGEESARALKAEQEAIDAAYAAGRAAVPPSFTPKNPSSASANTDVADAKLFGKLKTKVVAIIVAVIVVAVALGFAVHGLMQPSDSVTTDSKGPWPEINLDEVVRTVIVPGVLRNSGGNIYVVNDIRKSRKDYINGRNSVKRLEASVFELDLVRMTADTVQLIDRLYLYFQGKNPDLFEINYKTNKRLENTTKEVTELIGFMTKVSLNGFIISTKKVNKEYQLFYNKKSRFLIWNFVLRNYIKKHNKNF